MMKTFFVCLLLISMPAVQAQQQSAIDPKIDEVLKRMSTTLAAAKSFTFESHSIADQVLASGQKAQFARNQKIAVNRPDKIHATVVGDRDDLEFIYDGKQVTLLNPRDNVYATTDAKSSIDDTLDMLADQYGMVLPLADLVVADPHKALGERVRSAEDLGTGYVFETKCRHLAFRQEVVDWQIWIDESSNLPRKLVIIYKEQPGDPQYTAFLSNWNLSANVPDSQFTFTPPPSATKTEFAAPSATTQPAAAGK
jgi:hypothetical protein